jgi:hypothetical protein
MPSLLREGHGETWLPYLPPTGDQQETRRLRT